MADPHTNYRTVNPANSVQSMPHGVPMQHGFGMTGLPVAPSPYKSGGQGGLPPRPVQVNAPQNSAAPMLAQNRFQQPPPPQPMGGPGSMGAMNYRTPQPRPGMNMAGQMPQYHGAPQPPTMSGGMPPRPPHMTGPIGSGAPQPMGGSPQGMVNSLSPKTGIPPLQGPPPMGGVGPPIGVGSPPFMNGVPSSQPNYMGPPQPAPVTNGPPSGPSIPQPGLPPPAMGMPQTSGPPIPGQGHGLPLQGQFGGRRPPGPPMGARPPGPPQPGMTPPPYSSAQGAQPLLPGGRPHMTNSMQPPPPIGGQQNYSGSRTELPVPFAGQGQYSHQLNPAGISSRLTSAITPTNSEPVSQKSSRAPSPVPGVNYDALEGGQQPGVAAWSQGPPRPGQQVGSPPGPPPGPQGPPAGSQGPPPGPPLGQQGFQQDLLQNQDVSRIGGIAGKRQYPQMSGLTQPMAPPGSQMGVSPASGPGPMAQHHHQQYPALQQPWQQQYSPGLNAQVPPPQPGAAPNTMTSTVGQPQHMGYMPNNTLNNVNSMNTSFNNLHMGQTVTTPDRPINLMQERRLIPTDGVETVHPKLPHDYKKVNVNPDIFRCTLSTLPQSQSLLNKSRLPLGILIHPFRDLSQLPVVQSSVIVRCRSCRTYINPFVTFVDMRRWKCNLCYRINELPDEFNYDPVSKSYGEPQRRPEIRSATIEFIAPSEYMLRPPQPAVYLYVLDVSFNAISTGYLSVFCQTLLEELDRIPGDARTQIGFVTFDSALHFYNLSEGLSQPQMLVVSDIDDVFLPSPDSLLVNLSECKELVIDLLNQLPNMFEHNMETGNALGAALQASYKLLVATGGRVSVFQTQLPSVGPGALKTREDPNERAGKKIQHLGPATDFYKKLSLDCSAQQIAVDLFMLNTQYADLSTVACISKYSGGCLHYFPGLHTAKNPAETDRLEATLRRYFIRKIGFEAVMRIRCTRGLSIHTFHGNFFVRSTDLLSLPNINPDAGFGMQMSIEDTLESATATFQAALLYTSSKGERRIRVHTMCLPVTNSLSDVYVGADQVAITGLLAKMAVDKSISQSMGDARDAVINASIDMLSAYGQTLAASQRVGQLPVCFTLRLMPLYCLALLKYSGFRVGSSTKLDDRVLALEECKTLPLCYLIQELYPHLYPVHALDDKQCISKGDTQVSQPPLLQLSSANIDRHGAYILDTGSRQYLWIGGAISDRFCQEVLDVPNFGSIPDGLTELPELDNPASDRVRTFINYLNGQRPFAASLQLVRDDSRQRMLFLQYMVEDRTESTMSYYEFLQHLQKEVKS